MKKCAIFSLLVLLFFNGNARSDDKLHERPRYVLHPGDVLELEYRLTPEFNQTVTLEPDGHASLNVIGDVLLGGLTLDRAKAHILELASVQLNDPQLNLVLKDFEKPYVVVGGEVQTPGKIEMREDLTAMQALLLAGGPKSSAGTDKILLFRHLSGDEGRVIVLNLSKMKKTSDLERNIPLQPGDMMFVTTSRFDKFTKIMKTANFGLFLNPTTF